MHPPAMLRLFIYFINTHARRLLAAVYFYDIFKLSSSKGALQIGS
jgi:hypothetical protein